MLHAGLEFGARRVGVDADTSDARRRENPFPLPFVEPGDVIVMEVVAVGGDWVVGLRVCPWPGGGVEDEFDGLSREGAEEMEDTVGV